MQPMGYGNLSFDDVLRSVAQMATKRQEEEKARDKIAQEELAEDATQLNAAPTGTPPIAAKPGEAQPAPINATPGTPNSPANDYAAQIQGMIRGNITPQDAQSFIDRFTSPVVAEKEKPVFDGIDLSNKDLLTLGLSMMAAGGENGATFLGSAGKGGQAMLADKKDRERYADTKAERARDRELRGIGAMADLSSTGERLKMDRSRLDLERQRMGADASYRDAMLDIERQKLGRGNYDVETAADGSMILVDKSTGRIKKPTMADLADVAEAAASGDDSGLAGARPVAINGNQSAAPWSKPAAAPAGEAAGISDAAPIKLRQKGDSLGSSDMQMINFLTTNGIAKSPQEAFDKLKSFKDSKSPQELYLMALAEVQKNPVYAYKPPSEQAKLANTLYEAMVQNLGMNGSGAPAPTGSPSAGGQGKPSFRKLWE